MRMTDAVLIFFLGFATCYTVNESAEMRIKADYSELIGESIQSLKQKLKDCEKAKQGACELFVGVKVGK